MGWFTTQTDRLLGWFGYVKNRPVDHQTDAGGREITYAVNDALYDNYVYELSRSGGYLERILYQYFGINDCSKVRLVGHFNPIKEIVESYQNVIGGSYGKEIQLADDVDGEPVKPAILEPVKQIWRDSNLDSDKAMIQRHAANLGSVGLRAVLKPSGKVVVQYDHPSRIHYIEEDSEGNKVAVVLKYTLPRNTGTLIDPKYEMVEVIEVITKDEFSQTIDGVEQIPDEQRTNRYGFCPYVVMCHKDNGTPFGDWAYKGSERVIHAINYRISRQDKSIDRHQFPNWFAAAGGDKPETIDMGGEKLTYAKLGADTPTPFMQAIVANLDQEAAAKFWMELRDMLRGRQPELTINDVRLLSNVSGETVMQVLKPAESVILAARPLYEHAFIRVLQMCMSIGADEGLWDLGTGRGEGAGDRAYKSGVEAMAFAERPALPPTPVQQQAFADGAVADRVAKAGLAKQLQGLGVSEQEVLRTAGYTDKEIAAMAAEPRSDATAVNGVPTNPTANQRMQRIVSRLGERLAG